MDRAFLEFGAEREVLTGLYLDVEGRVPEAGELRRRVRRRAEGLPVLGLAAASDRSRWERVSLDVETHVRLLECAPGTTDAATSTLLRRALPGAGAPLWDLWLIAERGSERHRLCFRAHHALLDGVGIAHTVTALLADDELVRGPRPHRPLRPTVAAAGRLAREAVGSLRRERRWPELSAPATGEFGWVYADVAERRLRELAAAWGGTVNDVFLAALAGGFRLWRARGCGRGEQADLPVVMPMSVRRDGEEAEPGNRFVFGRLSLPSACADPARAMREVIASTERLGRMHYRDTAWPLYAARWLAPAVRAHLRRASECALVVPSHVHLPQCFACLGAPVRAAARLPQLAGGVRCYAGLTRVAGTARFAVVHDLGLESAAELPGLWVEALSGLETAAGVTPTGRAREGRSAVG